MGANGCHPPLSVSPAVLRRKFWGPEACQVYSAFMYSCAEAYVEKPPCWKTERVLAFLDFVPNDKGGSECKALEWGKVEDKICRSRSVETWLRVCVPLYTDPA